MIIIYQDSKRSSAMSCGNDSFESLLADDADVLRFTGRSALFGLEWLDVYFVSHHQWTITPAFNAYFRKNNSNE